MLLLDNRYNSATNVVPPMIASGSVRDGLRTLSTGVVAFSNPVMANRVSAAAVATSGTLSGTGGSGWNAPRAPWMTMIAITASSGNSLIATVTSASPPAERTPLALTSVSTTTAVIAAATTNHGPPKPGLIQDNAAANAIASPALPAQLEHQNDQATR